MGISEGLYKKLMPVGIFFAVVAGVSIAWEAAAPSEPRIEAYCTKGDFKEQVFPTFEQCHASQQEHIKKFGYVCACTRTDGPAGFIGKLIKWSQQ